MTVTSSKSFALSSQICLNTKKQRTISPCLSNIAITYIKLYLIYIKCVNFFLFLVEFSFVVEFFRCWESILILLWWGKEKTKRNYFFDAFMNMKKRYFLCYFFFMFNRLKNNTIIHYFHKYWKQDENFRFDKTSFLISFSNIQYT